MNRMVKVFDDPWNPWGGVKLALNSSEKNDTMLTTRVNVPCFSEWIG